MRTNDTACAFRRLAAFTVVTALVLTWATAARATTESDDEATAENAQATLANAADEAKDAEAQSVESPDDVPGDKSPPAAGSSVPDSGTQQIAPPSESGGKSPPATEALDAASSKLSFQALLKDNLGSPLPGPTVNLEFNLYAGGGALVQGPINLAAVPISNGVVDVQIPVSASSFDGTARTLGVKVNGGPELTPRTALTTVPYAFRVDRVASEELDDHISLGTASSDGSLTVYRTGAGTKSIELLGANSRISTYGDDGQEQIRLWGPTWGELLLNDFTGNDTTVLLSATSNSGGQLSLRDATGDNSILANGGTGQVAVESNYAVVSAIGGTLLATLTKHGGGAWLRTFDEAGAATGYFGSSAGSGGFAELYSASGSVGLRLDGEDSGAGLVRVNNASGSARVTLDGLSTGNGGEVDVHDADGTKTVEILGAQTSSLGARINLKSNTGANGIILYAEEFAGNGADIRMYNSAGVATIELDADLNGDGRIITQELQITGGSDLSEQFDVGVTRGLAAPGMVVSIDPATPGHLVLAAKAYERTVAGVISGAGGVKPGMVMGQRHTVADGKYPVALTGRVYCWCDASQGAIEPGDLLTTSTTPGHAMKVSDYEKAHGAVLGKAMSSLPEGRGLVLVLVALQ